MMIEFPSTPLLLDVPNSNQLEIIQVHDLNQMVY